MSPAAVCPPATAFLNNTLYSIPCVSRASLEGSIRSTLHTQGYDFDGVATALHFNRGSQDGGNAIPRKSSSFYISRTSSSATTSSSGDSRGPSIDRTAAARTGPQRRSSLSIVFNPTGSSSQIARSDSHNGRGELRDGVVSAGGADEPPSPRSRVGLHRRLTPVPSNDDVQSSSSNSGCDTPPVVPGGSKPPTRPTSMEMSRRSVEWQLPKALTPTKSL